MPAESKGNTFSAIIKEHLAKSHVNTHPAKLVVLSNLLEKLFDVKLEELIPGIEAKLGSKLLGVRGSADLIFSNVVFEIKVHMKRELADAESQLLKYFQALLEKKPEKKHIGIATDCVEFIAYAPKIKNGKVIAVSKLSSLKMNEVLPSESVLWLDSFIFSKPKIIPSAMDLRWRFGPESPTHYVAVDALCDLWDKAWNEREIMLKFDLWARNMEIVYGSRPKVASFIDHTYLVTLVKLIVYLHLSGVSVIKEGDLKKALTGEYFTSYGIANLIEEDFFAWILHEKIVEEVLQIVNGITRELLRYDLSQLDEDFFKEIYQEIVKRSERHRIGEYYTPEWLVQLIIGKATKLFYAKNHRIPTILDPACGSGTFLCNAIRTMRKALSKKGKKPIEILDEILESVVGVDINPLAVVIARANYVIALGDLLKVGKRKIIPIHVADSIKPPKVTRTIVGKGRIRVYEQSIEIRDTKEKSKSYRLQIPESIVADKAVFSEVLDSFKASVNSYIRRRDRREALEVFDRNCIPQLSKDELYFLSSTLSTIFKLVDEGNDAIWVFMLSNIYAPIILSRSKFDIVTGNPPWIAMRYVENKNYQNFLKDQVLSYNLLESGQVHLFTHMEMATLFFCRATDLYLNDKGLIAFVMPRSVLTGAMHHSKFKEFRKPKVKLTHILDLEEVSPLFNVPSCVLIATKGKTTSYPVTAIKVSGKLDEKNLRFSIASKQLSISAYPYNPPSISTQRSWYYDKMLEGATLVPRSLWFIDFEVHEMLGVDVSRPFVKTSEDISRRAREPWKRIDMRGNVEANFIYATLLGGDIVSFGFSRLRSVVLPLVPTPTKYRLFDIMPLRRKGFAMATWLEKAQKLWEERRTAKAVTRFPRVLGRLDYNTLLSSQNPRKKYVVLYNGSGTNIASCVIYKHARALKFSLPKVTINSRGFIVDYKSFRYETNDSNEAHYLCAVLNSNVINNLIKPLQPRGLFGEREIQRRPFLFPIPKFDKTNPKHVKLAEISKKCHKIMQTKDFSHKSTAAARSQARKLLRKEIERIDELVSDLLKL